MNRVLALVTNPLDLFSKLDRFSAVRKIDHYSKTDWLLIKRKIPLTEDF
jgi:hypothetical protein